MKRVVLLVALQAACVNVLDGAPCQVEADCPGDQCVAGLCQPDDGVRLTPSIAVLPLGGSGPLYFTPGTSGCVALLATNAGQSATTAPPVGKVSSPTPGVSVFGGGAVKFLVAVPAGKTEPDLGSGTGTCPDGVQLNVDMSVAPGTNIELDLTLEENGRVFTGVAKLPVMPLLLSSGFDTYTGCWSGTMENVGKTTINVTDAVLTSPTPGVELSGGQLSYSGSISPTQGVALTTDQTCWQGAPEIHTNVGVTFVEVDLTLTTDSGTMVLPSGYTAD